MNFTLRVVLLVVVIVVVPIMGFAGHSYWSGNNALEKFILNRVQGVNDLKKSQIQTYFRAVSDEIDKTRATALVVNLAPVVTRSAGNRTQAEYQNAARELNGYLTNYRIQRGYDDVKIVSADGHIVYVNNESRYTNQVNGTVPNDQAVAVKAGQSGLSISKMFLDDPEDGRYEVYVSAPIIDADKLIRGTLVFELDLTDLINEVRDVTGLSSTGETLLAIDDSYSALILNPLKYDPQAALTRRITYGGKEATAIQQATQGRSGRGEAVDYRGETILAAWDYIPELKWGIVTKIDRAEGLQVSQGSIRMAAIGFPVIFILVIVALIWLMGRMINRPLNHLSNIAEQLSNGNYDVKVDQKLLYSNDQFGQLATNLHHISHRLKYEQSGGKESPPDKK